MRRIAWRASDTQSGKKSQMAILVGLVAKSMAAEGTTYPMMIERGIAYISAEEWRWRFSEPRLGSLASITSGEEADCPVDEGFPSLRKRGEAEDWI